MIDLTEIGFVSKPHGFDGSLRVHFNANLFNPKKYPAFFWIYQYGKPVPYKIETFTTQENDSAILRFEDIVDEQAAKKLKNEKLFVENVEISKYFEEAESYNYLLGLRVIDKDLGEIGIIEDVVENENSHANLVILYKNKEVLIPFVDEFILKIDNQEIITNLPNGLLELYL